MAADRSNPADSNPRRAAAAMVRPRAAGVMHRGEESNPIGAVRGDARRRGRGPVARAFAAVLAAACWTMPLILLWGERPFLLDVLSNFALHAAAASAAAALPLLALRRWMAAAIAGAGLAATLALTLPHYHGPAGSAATGGATEPRRIKVLSFNVKSAAPAEGDPVYRWIEAENPDVICLIEAWSHFVRGSAFLREHYPYRIEPKSGMQWAMLLLSRHPFDEVSLAPFSGEIQSCFMIRRSVIVHPPGGPEFLFGAAHYRSPRRESAWRRSLHDAGLEARALRAWLDARTAGPEGAIPAIIGGDFNAAPTGRVHRLFARESGLTGWTRLFAGGTWPSNLSPWFSVPIDRIWTTPGVRCVSLRVGPRFTVARRSGQEDQAEAADRKSVV